MKRKVLLNKLSGSNNVSFVKDTVSMWLETAPNGDYRVTMEKVSKPRSINQNNLMWLWFTAIADEWSEASGKVFTRQNVHDVYCEMFLPVDTPKGRVGGSTSILSSEDMGVFLDRVQADAADDGIVLPSPEDKIFEVWRMQYER